MSVTGFRTRAVAGRTREYVTLQTAQGGLGIEVPVGAVEEIGIRPPIDEEALEQVYAVLRSSHADEPENWSRRLKASEQKIGSSEPLQLAEVVRDLTFRSTDSGLSSGERDLLNRATRPLAAEIALALRLTDEEAQAQVLQHVGA